ncbi:hypothetical protein GMD78_03205 [Ornithinibacillus sp. L9]|uniref:HTH luxR-type domain-containing protein n=1 Tax=Ornithinibacillus caprae TaxID=2678566 RepID=A0A6N8FI33_9BACI|nr:response regulator transcription factor [Ornithinibacillus caprae]MUK87409.1 hypothetical protein [Ornithinibacillus caprae]
MIEIILMNQTPFMRLIQERISLLEGIQVLAFQEISMELIHYVHADIVVFDLDEYIDKREKPHIPAVNNQMIVGVTESVDQLQLLGWLEAGMDSLLFKEDQTLENLDGIFHSITVGNCYIPPFVVSTLLMEMDKLKSIDHGKFRTELQNNKYHLTPKEAEIAYLMKRDLTNNEIARVIGISEGTVKVHISHIYKKLGMKKRKAVVELLRTI